MLGGQQLGAARLLEQRPAGLEVRAGRGADVGRGPERGAIDDQPRERRLPGRQGRLGPGDGLLGDAEPARIAFAPRVELGQDAAQLLDGLGRAPVGRADRDRETLAEGGLVAIEVLQLAMAARRPSSGRTTGVGSRSDRPGWHRPRRDRVVVTPSMVRTAVPPGPNAFSIEPVRSGPPAAPASTLKSRVIVGLAASSASHERRPSSAAGGARVGPATTEPVSPSSIAREIVDLPASFGPRMIVSPGARSICRSR